MAESVPLNLTAGLPYNRRFRVADGALIWATRELFEVRSQIRARKTVDSALLGALTPFLVASYDGSDIVVDLSMTGADTRSVPAGYYDILISDVGATDARALPIASGKVKVRTTVTAASDV